MGMCMSGQRQQLHSGAVTGCVSPPVRCWKPNSANSSAFAFSASEPSLQLIFLFVLRKYFQSFFEWQVCVVNVQAAVSKDNVGRCCFLSVIYRAQAIHCLHVGFTFEWAVDRADIFLKGFKNNQAVLCKLVSTRDVESWLLCVSCAIYLWSCENILVPSICKGSVVFLVVWQVGEACNSGLCCSTLLCVLCARNGGWNFGPVVLIVCEVVDELNRESGKYKLGSISLCRQSPPDRGGPKSAELEMSISPSVVLIYVWVSGWH